MRRRLLPAVVLAAVVSLVAVSAASACSYALAPGVTQDELDAQLLRGSDGAFIGTLMTVVPLGPARAAYLFSIDRRVKGRFPLDLVVVRAPLGGGLCGLELQLGKRTGLMVDRGRRGGWTSHLLLQLRPRDLLRAARRG